MHDLRIRLDTSPVIGFIASKVYTAEWLSSRGHLGHALETQLKLAWCARMRSWLKKGAASFGREKQAFGRFNDGEITLHRSNFRLFTETAFACAVTPNESNKKM